jgi:hypothetical protein
MQHLVAEYLAHAMLRKHGMPLEKEAKYNASKLPASPKHGVSDACYSCARNWVKSDSLEVVKDREKMVHCHACLRQSMGTDKKAVKMTRAVSHSLACRLLGKVIPSPMQLKAGEFTSSTSAPGAAELFLSLAAAAGTTQSMSWLWHKIATLTTTPHVATHPGVLHSC